jgi:hypothetical protein
LTRNDKESHAGYKTFLAAAFKCGTPARSMYKTHNHGKKVDKSFFELDFLCNLSRDGIVFSQDKVDDDEARSSVLVFDLLRGKKAVQ